MKKQALLTTTLILFTAITMAQGNTVEIETSVIEQEPLPLQAGEYANIWVEVQNNGTTQAEDLTVQFQENYPFSMDQGEKQKYSISQLYPGETRQYRFKVRVDEKAVQGTNDFKIKTKSEDGLGIVHEMPLEVRVDDTSLVIDSVDFPERVNSGSINTMEIGLNNLANGMFRNIDVKADIESKNIATVESSRKRIPSIEALGSDTVSFDIAVDEEADNGVYKIPLELSYEDEQGTETTTTQETGIIVGGSPRLDVGIETTELERPGQTASVTLNMVNKGEGEARFVDMQIQEGENYKVLSEDSVYLGTMISDDYQTAEFQIYADTEAEKLEIPVETNYVDENGEQQTETLTVENQLYTEEELSRYGINNQGSSTAIIVIFVLALVIGGAWYYRRRKN